MKVFIVCLGLFFGNLIYSQEVLGEWKTIDDNTGVAKSIVELYEENGEIFGRIKRILKEEKRNLRCTECKGDEKNQKVEGMVILKHLKEDGDEYSGGTITDPENGKSYDAKVWLSGDDPNTLKVRGYIAFLYRTQEWKRLNTK